MVASCEGRLRKLANREEFPAIRILRGALLPGRASKPLQRLPFVRSQVSNYLQTDWGQPRAARAICKILSPIDHQYVFLLLFHLGKNPLSSFFSEANGNIYECPPGQCGSARGGPRATEPLRVACSTLTHRARPGQELPIQLKPPCVTRLGWALCPHLQVWEQRVRQQQQSSLRTGPEQTCAGRPYPPLPLWASGQTRTGTPSSRSKGTFPFW